MPKLEVKEGIEIFYEELGSGDKYVLSMMMGFPAECTARALADEGYHVFLLTNRGIGESTHVFEDYGEKWYDIFADDVVAFADKMGIDKFVYTGCSHGAGTGWHVCLNYPERVSAFIAMVGGPHNIDEGVMSYRQMGELGLKVPDPDPIPDFDPAVMRRMERNRAVMMANRREQTPEEKALDYRRPLMKYGTEEKVQEALRTIQTPSLMIGGLEDHISRPDLMLRTAQCIPNGKTILYSRFGHSGPFEQIIEESVAEQLFFLKNVEENGTYYKKVEG